MPGRILIVGGDAAGMSAASRAARLAPDARVTVLEREAVVSYAACGMPYHLDGRIPDAAALLIRSPAAFAAAGIDVRLGHEVISIDPTAGEATVRRDGTTETTEPFDHLLLATGARAVAPRIPGADAGNVFSFRRYADLLTLSAHLDRERPRRVTVFGGGYIGVELADVLTERGTAVTLVEAAPALMPTTFDPDMAALVETELHGRGVTVHCGLPALAIETVGGRARAVRTGAQVWDCDAVIVGVGVRPASELADAAGIRLGAGGAIRTDAGLRTSADGVWAAGDCAATTDLVTGAPTWVPLGPAANKQGRVAAESMLGRPARFAGVVGTALVRAFGLEVGRTGLTEPQATAAGFEPVSVTITAGDRAPYYPGGHPTTVKLVADRRTRRLLGAQLVGRSGVAGRTNVVATALHAGFDLDEFVALDLGYAPPFAPVWDPLLVAGNQLVGAR